MGMGGEGVKNQEMNTYAAIPIQLLSVKQILRISIWRRLFQGTEF